MKTRIISVVGEKGGIGKTTLNILLASDFQYRKNKKVVLLDLDNPQYSIHKKRQRELQLFTEEQVAELDCYPIEPVTVDTLENAILKYYGLVDYIIIDLPGSLNVEMIKGLLYIEHIFIPFDHDELEIDSTTHFYFMLKENFLQNEQHVLRSAHLFFNKYRLVSKTKFYLLRNQLERSGMPLMKSVVKQKTDYKERYRNTLYPIADNKEGDEMGIKHFFEEVEQIANA